MKRTRYKLKAAVLTIFLLLGVMEFMVGCRTVEPFKRRPLPQLPEMKPAALLTGYAQSKPEVFSVMSGIIFNWQGRRISTLCVAAINRQTRKLSVVGMNLLGIKIFEATGNEHKAQMLFAAPSLKLDKPDIFATRMLKDIARIYLDNVPAKFETKKGLAKITFTSGKKARTIIKYSFGGNPPGLLKKQAIDGGAIIWQVRYFHYRNLGKYNLPHAIVYDNLKYNYRLVIRVKKFMIPANT